MPKQTGASWTVVSGFGSDSMWRVRCFFSSASLGQADAVPSFARQTGQECPACHVSWPELTPYGRFFKVTGYTIGKTFWSSEGINYVPVAVMAQASVSNIRNNSMTDPDTGDTVSGDAAPEQPGVLRRQPVPRHQGQRLHGRVLSSGRTTTWRPRPTARWAVTAASTTPTSARRTSTRR